MLFPSDSVELLSMCLLAMYISSFEKPLLRYFTNCLIRLLVFLPFPDGSAGKESACHAEDTADTVSVPESGRSLGEGKWQPTPVILPGEFHGQRSLVCYSSWGRRLGQLSYFDFHFSQPNYILKIMVIYKSFKNKQKQKILK